MDTWNIYLYIVLNIIDNFEVDIDYLEHTVDSQEIIEELLRALFTGQMPRHKLSYLEGIHEDLALGRRL